MAVKEKPAPESGIMVQIPDEHRRLQMQLNSCAARLLENPSDSGAMLGYAQALEGLGRRDEAVKQYDSVIRSGTRAEKAVARESLIRLRLRF